MKSCGKTVVRLAYSWGDCDESFVAERSVVYSISGWLTQVGTNERWWVKSGGGNQNKSKQIKKKQIDE